jgi:D-alanyl-D-alanine carboxypeptidase
LKKYTWTIMMLVLVLACKKADIVSSVACNADYVDSSYKHPNRAVYQAILDKYQKKGLPGIAVLINDDNGAWMGSAGKADIKAGVDFRPCTVSKVASMTKMFFAAAVLKLHEHGIVNLNDKISQWLPSDVINKVKNADKVTIRDLMQHTTGVYDIIFDADFYLAVLNNPNKHWTGKELIKFAYNKPSAFDYKDTLKTAEYSNTNTLLLSMCIEEITKRPHHEILRDLVFNKLGMSSTYYHYHEALPSSVAQGYFDLYNNGTIVNVSNLITGSGNGFNGVYSSVTDINKFMKALFIDKSLVSSASLDLMQTFVPSGEEGDIGVGLLQQYKQLELGHIGVGHSGGDLGYCGEAQYFPTRNNRIFVTLVNYGTNGDTPLKEVYKDMRAEFVKALLQ